jgi:hypothetical protein
VIVVCHTVNCIFTGMWLTPVILFVELLVRRDPEFKHGDCVCVCVCVCVCMCVGWMELAILCPSDDTRITKSYLELAFN